ncbi:hypothetical protein ACQP2P_41035 [Dactylosporangium sp. CA-139114]|uniref:hypothetical protein n=1 Tax=Dactylosporangium sp. CA-139114 TaxID=3239931 RepID=UPI003D959FFE
MLFFGRAISRRARVWCHLACQFLALAAAAPVATSVPHVDPLIVRAEPPSNPSVFGNHDLEDPPGPQWAAPDNTSAAAGGGVNITDSGSAADTLTVQKSP